MTLTASQRILFTKANCHWTTVFRKYSRLKHWHTFSRQSLSTSCQQRIYQQSSSRLLCNWKSRIWVSHPRWWFDRSTSKGIHRCKHTKRKLSCRHCRRWRSIRESISWFLRKLWILLRLVFQTLSLYSSPILILNSCRLLRSKTYRTLTGPVNLKSLSFWGNLTIRTLLKKSMKASKLKWKRIWKRIRPCRCRNHLHRHRSNSCRKQKIKNHGSQGLVLNLTVTLNFDQIALLYDTWLERRLSLSLLYFDDF